MKINIFYLIATVLREGQHLGRARKSRILSKTKTDEIGDCTDYKVRNSEDLVQFLL